MNLFIFIIVLLEHNKKIVYSKKYGVDFIRFTHHQNAVICASKNNWDESLRYWSLHDNRYLRYFKGHRNSVVSLSMSPVNDTFISGSADETIRLWDLRSNACQGLMRVKERPCVSYDPQGLIFAAAYAPNIIKLFDLRTYDKGPFDTFYIAGQQKFTWTHMKFSNDGKFILLSTDKNLILLTDAFSGEIICHYEDFVNNKQSMIEASFSPDAQFVLSGSEDHSVYVWHTVTGKRVAKWTGHTDTVSAVQWNPKYMMAATACTNLAFRIPETNDNEQT